MLRALEEEVAADRLDRIDVLSLLDRFEARNRSGVRRSALGSQTLFVLQAWRMMRRRPDLVLIDHLGLGRAFRLPLPGIRPRRTVVFVHGTEFWEMKGGARASVVRSADRLLTNSRFTARTVMERMPEVADRVIPILLCIDPELTSRWELSAAPSSLAERERAVLVVGRMEESEPGKGHEALLAAWPAVRRAVPDAVLWVVGDGSKRSVLEVLARDVEPGAVRFFGKVSDSDLSTLYRRASLFAMPSRQEGFGLVYAEAMWHGLPCIASNADAGAEVVREGETGSVVPYGAPDDLARVIIDLLLDPERRRILGENARREAYSRFGYARFKQDFLDSLRIESGG